VGSATAATGRAGADRELRAFFTGQVIYGYKGVWQRQNLKTPCIAGELNREGAKESKRRNRYIFVVVPLRAFAVLQRFFTNQSNGGMMRVSFLLPPHSLAAWRN